MRASSRRVRSRRFGTCPHFELGAALPFLLFECSTHLTLEMWPPGRREAGDYLFAKAHPAARGNERGCPRGGGARRDQVVAEPLMVPLLVIVLSPYAGSRLGQIFGHYVIGGITPWCSFGVGTPLAPRRAPCRSPADS